MRRLVERATPEHLMVFALGIGLVVLACLSPVQNDTWWHLRSGEEMVRTRTLLFEDRFTTTVYDQFFWNHSWLSQVIFYGLFRAGGLPLLTLVCASVIASAWAVVWRLMRGPTTDRLIFVAVAVASATVTWSIRPQVFSLLLAMVAAWCASEDRWRPLPLVFVLWANLHAGFVMGIALLGASVLSALLFDRSRFWSRASWTLVCVLATAVTPLGFNNWRQVAESMTRSHANAIQEWQPTAWPPENLAFWGIALLLVALVVRRWRSLEHPSDRVLVVAAAIVLPLAVRSLRNVPIFAMVAAPAISRLFLQKPERRNQQAPTVLRPAVTLTIAALVMAMGAAVVVAAWSQSWPLLGWRPIGPEAVEAIRSCRGPIYNTYEGGGPIIWFVPSQRVFIDSRQDPFPVSLIQQATEVERTGEYRELFGRWSINCAVLPPESPTIARLAADGWTPRFKDQRWVVLDRPGSTSTTATTSPAP